MIQNQREYQFKYQEMMNLSASIRILESRNFSENNALEIEGLKNKLTELQIELYNYREANS